MNEFVYLMNSYVRGVECADVSACVFVSVCSTIQCRLILNIFGARVIPVKYFTFVCMGKSPTDIEN